MILRDSSPPPGYFATLQGFGLRNDERVDVLFRDTRYVLSFEFLNVTLFFTTFFYYQMDSSVLILGRQGEGILNFTKELLLYSQLPLRVPLPLGSLAKLMSRDPCNI